MNLMMLLEMVAQVVFDCLVIGMFEGGFIYGWFYELVGGVVVNFCKGVFDWVLYIDVLSLVFLVVLFGLLWVGKLFVLVSYWLADDCLWWVVIW